MVMSLCSVDEFFECLDAGSIILSPGKSIILVFSGSIAIMWFFSFLDWLF